MIRIRAMLIVSIVQIDLNAILGHYPIFRMSATPELIEHVDHDERSLAVGDNAFRFIDRSYALEDRWLGGHCQLADYSREVGLSQLIGC
jgi:hypothetical protein